MFIPNRNEKQRRHVETHWKWARNMLDSAAILSWDRRWIVLGCKAASQQHTGGLRERVPGPAAWNDSVGSSYRFGTVFLSR